MFDIDTGKLLIVAVLALIVIGPKDLPRVMRQVGQSVGKLRRMASEFQGQFMDAIKDAEIDDIRKELKDLETKADLDYNFNPARDIQTELTGIHTDLTSAIESTTSTTTTETSVHSPADGFALPSAHEVEGETTVLAEGIAPALPETETGETIALEAPGTETAKPAVEIPKRKLFIKPHRSRFARVNSERTTQMTGQALSIRQRVVRVRKPLSHDVLST